MSEAAEPAIGAFGCAEIEVKFLRADPSTQEGAQDLSFRIAALPTELKRTFSVRGRVQTRKSIAHREANLDCSDTSNCNAVWITRWEPLDSVRVVPFGFMEVIPAGEREREVRITLAPDASELERIDAIVAADAYVIDCGIY